MILDKGAGGSRAALQTGACCAVLCFCWQYRVEQALRATGVTTMAPARLAKAGTSGRSLGAKAGGEGGVHSKGHAAQHDEDQMQVVFFVLEGFVDLLCVLYRALSVRQDTFRKTYEV